MIIGELPPTMAKPHDHPSKSYPWGLAVPDGATNVFRMLWFPTRKRALTAAAFLVGRDCIISKHCPFGRWT